MEPSRAQSWFLSADRSRCTCGGNRSDHKRVAADWQCCGYLLMARHRRAVANPVSVTWSILADLWQTIVRELWTLQGETQRDLAPLEAGHVATELRTALLRQGLTETAAAAPAPGGGLGVGGPQAQNVDAGTASGHSRRATPEALCHLGPCFGLRARAGTGQRSPPGHHS